MLIAREGLSNEECPQARTRRVSRQLQGSFGAVGAQSEGLAMGKS